MEKHDFKQFPELTNKQMEIHYFESPHKQITEDFRAQVVKVIDGDTIRVKWKERDFDFPVRFLDIAAPELKKEGGNESQRWLAKQIFGEMVKVIVDPKIRVGKWGRLIGKIIYNGLDVGEESIRQGHAVKWENRHDHEFPELPDINKELKIEKWH